MKKLLFALFFIAFVSCNTSHNSCVIGFHAATIDAAKVYNKCIAFVSPFQETELNAVFSLKLADW